MGNRSKYRKLPELYTRGDVLPLAGDLVMWLQIMSPFEVEEARRDAQTARARLTLAMKEIGSPEYDALKATYMTFGRERVLDELVEIMYTDFYMAASNALEVDEDWSEKIDILRRSDEIATRPADDPEFQLLAKINADWLLEINRRVEEESALERERLTSLTDTELYAKYEGTWLERRGNQAALSAYGLTEVLYSCRACDGVCQSDGTWDHSACDHSLRVFESAADVRALPEALFDLIREGLTQLVMGQRDARFSARLGSSSESSPQPSPEEESTPSTPTETPVLVPGP